MEIIGRDKISQSGSSEKVRIDNRQNQSNNWVNQLILGVFISVIAAGIIYWFGWK